MHLLCVLPESPPPACRCPQLLPPETSGASKGISDPVDWVAAVWQPEVHGPTLTTFLINDKASVAAGSSTRTSNPVRADAALSMHGAKRNAHSDC